MTVLAALLADLVTLVTGQLTQCGRPPDRALIYHGGPIPDDCCTEAGGLSVWWNPMYASDRRPSAAIEFGVFEIPTVEIGIRLARCWPIPAKITDALTIDWDTLARTFADDALIVTLALGAAVCDDTFGTRTGCHGLAYRGATPIRPSGGCAGVEWKITAALRPTVEDLCPAACYHSDSWAGDDRALIGSSTDGAGADDPAVWADLPAFVAFGVDSVPLAVNSGALEPTGEGIGGGYLAGPPVLNVTVEATVGQFTLDLVSDDPSVLLAARIDEATSKIVTGQVTNRGAFTIACVDSGTTVATAVAGNGTVTEGDTITLRCYGTTISGLVNGNPVVTVDDPAPTAGGYAVAILQRDIDLLPWRLNDYEVCPI